MYSFSSLFSMNTFISIMNADVIFKFTIWVTRNNSVHYDDDDDNDNLFKNIFCVK